MHSMLPDDQNGSLRLHKWFNGRQNTLVNFFGHTFAVYSRKAIGFSLRNVGKRVCHAQMIGLITSADRIATICIPLCEACLSGRRARLEQQGHIRDKALAPYLMQGQDICVG